MSKLSKLRDRILTGSSDANIGFMHLRHLLIKLKFDEKIKGDHHIFTRRDVTEIINLQPKGNEAKAYQVKQVRGIFVKYNLGDSDVD
jgi:hypothetical protein